MRQRVKSAACAIIGLVVLSVILPPRAHGFGEDIQSFRDITLTPEPDKIVIGGVRADAQEISTLLNVQGLADQIRQARDAHTFPLPRSIEQARLICLYRIFIASQEVRKAIATLDFELAKSNSSLGALSAKRDAARNMLTTLNFAQGGTAGIVKQSLSFPGGAKQPVRQEIAMSSFGTSIGLSLVNLTLPSIWSRKIDSAPNTLSIIFDGRVQPADADRSYLWKFLNSTIPGSSSTLTRRTILLRHLETISRIDPQDDKTHKRIAAMPDASNDLDENIRILNQRINLLHDLKTHLEEFDASLYEFHQAITINN